MQRIRPIEMFLIQVIIYGTLWFFNDYLAFFMSLVFATISFFVFVISLIAEWIEPSKVPKWYFKYMAVSFIAPILTSLVFVFLLGGKMPWLEL